MVEMRESADQSLGFLVRRLMARLRPEAATALRPGLKRAASRRGSSMMSRLPRAHAFEVSLAVFALLYLLVFAGLPLIYNIVLSFQQVDLMAHVLEVGPEQQDMLTTMLNEIQQREGVTHSGDPDQDQPDQ